MTSLDEACAAVADYKARKRESVEKMAAALIWHSAQHAPRDVRTRAYRAAGITDDVDIRCWDHHAVALAGDVSDRLRAAA